MIIQHEQPFPMFPNPWAISPIENGIKAWMMLMDGLKLQQPLRSLCPAQAARAERKAKREERRKSREEFRRQQDAMGRLEISGVWRPLALENRENHQLGHIRPIWHVFHVPSYLRWGEQVAHSFCGGLTGSVDFGNWIGGYWIIRFEMRIKILSDLMISWGWIIRS